MKIETRRVDDERGIVQITTSDERWYQIDDKFYPSVTWICGYYPKGIGYMKWLSEHGWDEAEAVKQAAGEKGTKVHKAISDILMGRTVKIGDKYSADGREPEELTAIEYEAIMSFVNWLNETQPEVMAIDYALVNEEEGYAGTIDMKLKIEGEVWIVDIKTSKDVYPSHELQLSAYKKADLECQRIAILQVGYTRNKAKYKFTEIEDQYPLFQAAKAIWARETAGVHPQQKDFPLELVWDKTKTKAKPAKVEAAPKAA
ncbi:MAG TPA: hypothetical protein VKB38_13130 [Terracidiphilus sp.]|nr:hypothetical protein [Terracidiphilus sp.]